MNRVEIRTMFLDYIDEPLASPWAGDMDKVDLLLKQSYNTVISYIVAKCKRYYITEATVTVASGDKTVVMPTGFSVLERITDISTDKDLIRQVPRGLEKLTSTGRPVVFWEYDRDHFNIYPIPNMTYSYLIKYRYKPVWPTDDTTEVEFPEGNESLIGKKAAIDSAAKLREGPDELSIRRSIFDADFQLMLESINTNPQNIAHSAVRGF